MELNKGTQLLSDLTVYTKYARYDDKLKRREKFSEIVDRNKQMHLSKFESHENYPKIKELIDFAYSYVYTKNVLPSMRSLQYAGKAIERQNIRIFNCSYRTINDLDAFREIFYLLLMGCGVGYSVQQHHVKQLPSLPFRLEFNHDPEKSLIIIEDTAEGWAVALQRLIENTYNGIWSNFNYSLIRKKGTPLKTSGGLAPGHEVLKSSLDFISSILYNSLGRRLRSIEVHSILCKLAECVLSGGNRRSALLALFSKEDNGLLSCKSGDWFKTNPHFSLANNSVVIEREGLTYEEFTFFINKAIESGYGEPGIYLTNNIEYGCNPCCEASLENKTCCNLTTINVEKLDSRELAINCVKAAVIIGTLQASYTLDTFLSSEWMENIKKDALLGVSFTGIASNNLNPDWLQELSAIAVSVNSEVSSLIGINPAKRIGLIKPEGTSSCLLGTSSGIHPYYSKYYIRRFRLNKSTSFYKYLKTVIPNLIEDCNYNSNDGIVCIPMKSPDNAITTEEDNVYSLMKNIKTYYQGWVLPTHQCGDNTHNISCTFHYNEYEKNILPLLFYTNKEFFNGITIFPKDENFYTQAPYEKISKEQYKKLLSYVVDYDLNFEEELYLQNNFEATTGCDGVKCTIEYGK